MILPGDVMSPAERVRAILDFEEPDRLPMFLMAIPEYSQTIQELKERADMWADWTTDPSHIIKGDLPFLAQKPDRFTVRVFFGDEIQNYPVNLKLPAHFSPLVLDKQGVPIEDPDAKARIWTQPEGRFVDELGQVQGWRVLPGGFRYIWYIDGYLKTKQAVLEWYEEYGWPHEWGVSPVTVEKYAHFQAQYADQLFLVPQIGRMQLYESCWPIMGQARWAYFSRKDPAFIQLLIDSRKDAQLQILDEIKRLKPSLVMGGDDLGQKGRPLVSPAWFTKFLASPYKEICAKVHEDLGAKIFNHSCGNIVELLPAVIEAGWDGWQSLEPAAEIDYFTIKRKYGDHFLFVGALDSSRELCFGTPTSIDSHVKQQIRVLGQGGGYIPGPAHDYLNVPLVNALALRDAVHKWGMYPLS